MSQQPMLGAPMGMHLGGTMGRMGGPMGGFMPGMPGMYPHSFGMPQGNPMSPGQRPAPSPKNKAVASPPGSGPRSANSAAAHSPRYRSSPQPAQAQGSIKLQQSASAAKQARPAPGAETTKVAGAGTSQGVMHGAAPRSSLSPPSGGQASFLGASSENLCRSPPQNSHARPEDRQANSSTHHQDKMPSQAPQQWKPDQQNKMPSQMPSQAPQQHLRGPDRYQPVNQPSSQPRMPVTSNLFTDGRGAAKGAASGRPSSNPGQYAPPLLNFQGVQRSDAPDSARTSLPSPSPSLRLPEMLHIPFEPFSWSLFGPGGEAEKLEPNQHRPAPPGPPAKPMVGMGMLLKEKWLPKHNNVSSVTFTVSDIFAGIERKEKVWSVADLAPGFGAAESGKVFIDDIIIRIDGEYITGETSLEHIAKLLHGPVGTFVKLSVERDPAASASDSISVYSTNMSVMSTTSTFDGRKANTVFRILRTQGSSLPHVR